MDKPYREGTTLDQILTDGWSRGCDPEQTLDEAKAMGFTLAYVDITAKWHQLTVSMEVDATEKIKNERLLFLAGQMAEAAIMLVGGQGLNFKYEPCDLFNSAAPAEVLRNRVERYNDAILQMESEKENG